MMKDYVRDGKVITAVLEDGREVKMASEFIDKMCKNLEIDEYEAVMTWLEDEEYIINDEQAELNTKAKDNKVLPSLHRLDGRASAKKGRKTVKENPLKESIIAEIANAVSGLDNVSDMVIENKGKIITFKIGDESFKIDLIQRRKKKA